MTIILRQNAEFQSHHFCYTPRRCGAVIIEEMDSWLDQLFVMAQVAPGEW
jgi:hypothetical protein